MPRSEIAGSLGISIFWGNPIMFSTLAAPVYSSTNSAGFLLLHILVNIHYLLSFDNCQFYRIEMISHCVFDLCFSDYWGSDYFLIIENWGSLHVPVGHLCVFTGIMSFLIYVSIFNGVICLILICMSCLYALEITPYQSFLFFFF